jgi:hypothetical protein
MTAVVPIIRAFEHIIVLAQSQYGPSRKLGADLLSIRHQDHRAAAKKALAKSKHFVAKRYKVIEDLCVGQNTKAVFVEREDGEMVTIISTFNGTPTQGFQMAFAEVTSPATPRKKLCHAVPEKVCAVETTSGIFIERRGGFLGMQRTYFIANRQAFNALYKCVR